MDTPPAMTSARWGTRLGHGVNFGNYSVRPTLTRLITAEDGHLDPHSITASFKGRSAFTFDEERKHEVGKLFLERFVLTIKNCRLSSVRDYLVAMEKGAIPPAVSASADGPNPAEEEEEGGEAEPETPAAPPPARRRLEIAEQHNSAIYAALLLLTDGTAVQTVQRYGDTEDGMAALRALQRIVYKDTVQAHLPSLKKRLANFTLSDTVDPTKALQMYTELQRSIARITTYDSVNQLADLINLLPERYAALALRDYDDVDHLVSTMINHWNSFIKDKVKKTPRNPPQHTAAGIAHGGRGGGGGRQGRGGGAGRGRGSQGGGRGARVKACYTCGATDHFSRACPYKAVAENAIQTARGQAVAAATGSSQSQDSAASVSPASAAPPQQGTKLEIKPAAAGALVAFEEFGDMVAGIISMGSENSLRTDSYLSLLVAMGILFLFLGTVSLVVGMLVYLLGVARTPSAVHHAGAVHSYPNLKSFYVDSCATIHVCNRREWFDTLDTSLSPSANAVAEGPTQAEGIGTLRFCPTSTDGSVVPIVLTNVWYIPKNPFNLLSYSAAEDAGMDIDLKKRRVSLGQYDFDIIKTGNKLYLWGETDMIAAVRPRVPRDRADWQLFKSIFAELLDRYSTADPKEQWVELFRATGNEICAEGYDAQNSAFDVQWTGRDFYGNPVYEEQFIYRTLDKVLTDFSKDPENTRFMLLVPDWPTSSWYGFVKHFKVVRKFEKGTVMFSAPAVGVYDKASLTPAGDEGAPGRYIIGGTPFPVLALFLDHATVTKIDESVLLHLRMGHPGERVTNFLANNYEHGLQPHKASRTCKHCSVCRLAKGTRKPTYPSNSEYDQFSMFELVFSDIFGPVNPTSRSGKRYAINFMCATSRYPLLFFMDSRADSASVFAEFLTMVHQLGFKVQRIVLRTDNDTAYQGDLQGICESEGIRQETTAPYVHTNAAVAERYWRTLLDITRALLALSGVGQEYWTLAMRHANYLYARRPHSSLEFQSPYEQVFGVKPSLAHLRVFGSEAFCHVEDTLRPAMGMSKLDPKTVQGVYVGHDDHSATTLVLMPDGKVVKRGHVSIIENVDDGGRVQKRLHAPIPPMLHDTDNPELLQLPDDFDDCESVVSFSKVVAHSVVFDGEHETLGLVRVVTPTRPGGVWVYAHALLHQDSQADAPQRLQKYLAAHRRTTPLNVFHPIFAEVTVKSKGRGAQQKDPEPAFVVSFDSKSKTGYQVGYITDRQQGCQDVQNGQVMFPEVVAMFTAAISSDGNRYQEPQSYEHSKSYPDSLEWEIATQKELQSFLDLEVLDPCDERDIPSDKYIVSSRIVYKLKFNKDGTVDKYKARLVCRGFTQVYGENYEETFAPVSQLVTVRLVIALCLHFRMIPHHLDVKTAFLNSTLRHEVYVKLPPGVTINGKGYGKALKSIYGLKQAAHDWYQTQEEFILKFDERFRKSKVDPCLYVIVERELVVLISTHVDDYVVASTSDEWYQGFLSAFKNRFEVNDLGILDHLLQMSIEWQPFYKGVSISQERYIRDVAAQYGLLDCKPMQTPMEKGLKLEPAKVCDLSLPYRSIIGALLWIARASRPDIMFAVIFLSKFLACFDEQHFKAAKRVVRYLVTTIDRKLTFHQTEKSDELKVIVYTDSDWAGDSEDRRSFSGNAVFLNGCCVSWYCKKQTTVALSSVEAEYMALSDAGKEALYAKNILTEFFTVALPIPINMDNKGAGNIAENDVNNKLTKHIDIRYHFVRQYIQMKVMELFYVPTDLNVADIFTKALGPDVFNRLACMLLRIPS